MDPEEQARALLSPSIDAAASVKIFPYIRALKKDVIVSESPQCAGVLLKGGLFL